MLLGKRDAFSLSHHSTTFGAYMSSGSRNDPGRMTFLMGASHPKQTQWQVWWVKVLCKWKKIVLIKGASAFISGSHST